MYSQLDQNQVEASAGSGPRTTLRLTSSGALASLELQQPGGEPLSLLQYPATELEAGPANLWLRVRGVDGVRLVRPMTGPASRGELLRQGDRVAVRGQLDDVVHLAWFESVGGVVRWHWALHNGGSEAVTVDLVATLDAALAPLAEVRRNEHYVSQYLDLTPLVSGRPGELALCVRQNMPAERSPWLALGSTLPVSGWATDALQLHGLDGGLDLFKDLPGTRLQHEHTLASLQTAPLQLAPGQDAEGHFWIVATPDHPAATGDEDHELVARALAVAARDSGVATGWTSRDWRELPGQTVATSLFCPASIAVIAQAESPGGNLRLVESGPDGAFWAAHRGEEHVVSAAKERAVLRPHGSVLHLSPSALPDSQALACTVWMAGTFASQLTAGHASSGERLTIRRSWLGLSRAAGARILVSRDGRSWQLLDGCTLWRSAQRGAAWTYRLAGELAGSTIEVRTSLADTGRVVIDVEVNGAPLEVLLVLLQDNEGVELRAEGAELGDDSVLFADGRSRMEGVLSARLRRTAGARFELVLPGVANEPPAHGWRSPRLVGSAPGVELLSQYLSDLTRDAAVHYQAPRGLEQYVGGAWGTRDVCQGPVGLLLASDELAALRQVLLTIFAGQQDDGNWPQWFQFLPDAVEPGHRESHGDVVYWPLLALAHYLQATGDTGVMAEAVVFVGTEQLLAPAPLREHVERAVAHALAHRTRDPRLPSYGHGDWNDSLQPAREELASQMCSTWTSWLEIESFTALADQLAQPWPAMADKLRKVAADTQTAFGELLLVDDELAGYAVFPDPPATAGEVQLLVHPRDELTGLHHGVLPMIHAISGELLTSEQAWHHRDLVHQHLLGPTGAYLFDRPVAYSGGPMHLFKRAEAATFWGREIGLMYTHAHVRWVEALTHLGLGDEAWHELLKVVPLWLSEGVAGAAPRQTNCYYSSSDAAFADRQEASRRADDLFDPATVFEGGWRVYSSGPGLILRLVTEKFLGLRRDAGRLVVDPVLPVNLDGLEARVAFGGGELTVRYHLSAECGVSRVQVNGIEVATQSRPRPYRSGGVLLEQPLEVLFSGADHAVLDVWIGS